MQIRPDLDNRSGAILIVTLWVLAILAVFAIALGQRASLEIKLAQYQRDKLRAIELTKAAIERAILEKKNDPLADVDALSESWANNAAAFKDFELGDETFTGTFTVSYSFDGIGDEEKAILYGMEDEQSKININEVDMPILVNLLENCGVENEGVANEIANSIVAWRTDSDHEEDAYYESPDLPYPRKRGPFKSIPELLLVRYGEEGSITPEILYGEDIDDDGKISEDEQGIAQYLTVYGDGKVNINTASERVLTALISGSSSSPDLNGEPDLVADLVDGIVRFRKGDDGEIGTIDDNWFAINDATVNLEGELAKNLRAAYTPFDLVDPDKQWTKLQNLENDGKLCVSSRTYTVHADAEVRKVRKSITATIGLSEADQIKYLDWHRN